MKLFHMPNTRSARVLWCAHETGADLDLQPVDLRTGEHKTPEFLAMHPLGKVPAAQVHGVSVFESGALCQLLAEQSDNGFLPTDPAARARCYTLSYFAASELDRKTIGAFLQILFRKEEDRDADMLAEVASLWKDTVTPYLSGVLGDKPYLLGDQVTLADVMIGYDCVYAGRMDLLDDNLGAYVGRLAQRPGFQASFAM
jgi:glutathione S-transferase